MNTLQLITLSPGGGLSGDFVSVSITHTAAPNTGVMPPSTHVHGLSEG